MLFRSSINFDWLGGTTWDTSPGRKAPKMCKVTISFSPIHDITPGLDSLGHNRAPIYPVGVDYRMNRNNSFLDQLGLQNLSAGVVGPTSSDGQSVAPEAKYLSTETGQKRSAFAYPHEQPGQETNTFLIREFEP